MQEKDLADLIRQYNNGTISPEDRLLLENWYLKIAKDGQVPIDPAEMEARLATVWNNLETRQEASPRRISAVLRYAVAAVVLIAMGTALYWHTKDDAPEHYRSALEAHGILPGENKATLLLQGGESIPLSKDHEHVKAGDNGFVYDDGTSVLDLSQAANNDKLTNQLVSLITPRGGQYQITLPDGSRVWLNSASILKYPMKFAADGREVSIDGEAYFEINPIFDDRGDKIPFVVNARGQRITVVGTEFNVYAYDDEPLTKTTLVKGGVTVGLAEQGTHQQLVPGQQAITRPHTSHVEVKAANINSEVSWRYAKFVFDDESLQSIMRKISRWYDVDIAYGEGVDLDERYGGSFSREGDILDVLRKIELTGEVSFAIDQKAAAGKSERKVSVMKQ